MRRWLATSVLTALLLASAAPAAADPAGPTNYRSVVTGIETDGDEPAVDVEIFGGDAFLVLDAPEGTEVAVPGYDEEPYLRFSADGTVEVNERSPARYLNDARYGAAEVDVPEAADPEAPPAWRTVATNGTYAWHDHRVHWMSPEPPGQIDTSGGAQPVFDWSVPLTVGGDEASVEGELTWLPAPGPLAGIVPAVLVALAAVAVAVWRPRGVAVAVAVGSVAALAVGLASSVGVPNGGEADPIVTVLPAISVALLGVGAVSARVRRSRGAWLVAAAGVPLLVWTVPQVGALVLPIVPSLAPTVVVRTGVVLALAGGVAGLVSLGRLVLAATSLDVGDDEHAPTGGIARSGTGA